MNQWMMVRGTPMTQETRISTKVSEPWLLPLLFQQPGLKDLATVRSHGLLPTARTPTAGDPQDTSSKQKTSLAP